MQRTGGGGILVFEAGGAPAADRPYVIPPKMKRVLVCIFWIGVPLFTVGIVAISLAIARVGVPHDLIVWTLLPGLVAVVIGSLAFGKSSAKEAGRGFEVVQPDERRAG